MFEQGRGRGVPGSPGYADTPRPSSSVEIRVMNYHRFDSPSEVSSLE